MSGEHDLARERAMRELLDEESLAVLGILLAVSLEFGFGFAKTVVWWAGLIAGPLSMLLLVTLFRAPPTRRLLVRLARLVVSGEPRRAASPSAAARTGPRDLRPARRSGERR